MQKRLSRKRRIWGVTLIEAMTAAFFSAMLVMVSMAVFTDGLVAWVGGQQKIVADLEAQQAVRTISIDLRKAMSVAVWADGSGLTYRMPQVDASGNIVTDANQNLIWDGVVRNVSLVSGRINVTAGATTRQICSSVITTDPHSGTVYRVFTAGPGAVTRSVNIQIVTQRPGPRSTLKKARIRETIYLRNVPSVTR